ncbi:MAG TPA: universal stress protein [Gaiellaceae bacterium]|nr:universal stress protein [Gaiellaceae bacterium]
MKILLAYDGFEHSRSALEEVALLAHEDDGSTAVTIASVVPESEARASKAGGHRLLAPHAHIDVARGHEFLADRGVASEMKVLHGDPVEELCREAKTGGYDLVVTGSRALGPLAGLVLGSVSRKLVSKLSVPVLVAGRNGPMRAAA